MAKKLNSYLTFRLDNDFYAINVGNVVSINEPGEITPVPQTPEFMLGITNLRGNVLPVIDLKMKFGMGKTKFTKNTVIIVINVELPTDNLTLGIVVDAVSDVFDKQKQDILPPPTMGVKYKAKFIQGSFKDKNDNFVIILNVENIFSTDEMTMIKESSDN